MQVTKKDGRRYGLLFLAAAITGGAGTTLRGLSGAHKNTTTFLNSLVENGSQMQLAIGLDLLASGIAFGITIYLFSFIKSYSYRMALTYFGIGLMTFVIIAISNAFHVGLLTLGSEFVNANDQSAYGTLALIGYDTYYWLHFLMLVLYAIGGLILFYFFFKSGLLPKWLAAWGILANSIVFSGGALQLFDIPVSFYLFVQNGIFVLSLILWLLIKGFRPFQDH